MYDLVEHINKSLIQHGPYNDRIYLMNLDETDYPNIFKRLDELAKNKGYSKIFAKIPKWAFDKAKEFNYTIEAVVPGFFNDTIDGYFISKFLSRSRSFVTKETKEEIEKIKEKFKQYKKKNKQSVEFNNIDITRLSQKNASSLAHLYKTVFTSYPFPIHDKDYLSKMMLEDVYYYGIFLNDELVSASAAEIDRKNKNVEMTDFATSQEYRGNNSALFLLSFMEKKMEKEGIKTSYTIARAKSYGMNLTFAKRNYDFAGLLINNTNISGSIENMNVLYKKI